VEIKYGKIVKSLEFFFLYSKLQQVLIYWKRNIFCFGEILFHLACVFTAHHAKSFVPAFFMSVLITYLIMLSLEKEIIVLEKSLEKVLNFGSKNLDGSCTYFTGQILFQVYFD